MMSSFQKHNVIEYIILSHYDVTVKVIYIMIFIMI